MDYDGSVIQEWREMGCLDTIKARLGYRFLLRRLAMSKKVTAGESFELSLNIFNDGFGRLFNPRTIYLVLEGDSRIDIPLESDPRDWAPGSPSTVKVATSLPQWLNPGTYKVGLWMPDSRPELRNNPYFSLRLPYDVHWEHGVNWFTETLTVE